MTDINGGSGANGQFGLNPFDGETSDSGQPTSVFSTGLPQSNFADPSGKQVTVLSQQPEVPPRWVMSGIDTMPQLELEAAMAEHVANSDSPLAAALYSTSPDALTAEGWAAVNEFGATKVAELTAISGRLLETGLDGLEPGDLRTVVNTVDLLADIELVQNRLGLSNTPTGQFVSIASATANSLSSAMGGTLADPVSGQAVLGEVHDIGEYISEILAAPTQQQLTDNYFATANAEVLVHSLVAENVRDTVFSDLGVPRMADGTFDISEMPTAAEVNSHELQQDASFIRLVDPGVESQAELMMTGRHYPDGLPHNLDFTLSEFIGVPADPVADFVQDQGGSDEEPVVEVGETSEQDNGPVVEQGEPGFMESVLGAPEDSDADADVDADVDADADADADVEPEVEPEVEAEPETDPVVETEATASVNPFWQPISIDFHRIEESASDLDTVFEAVLSNLDDAGEADILFDTPLMARFTVFLEDLSGVMDQITDQEAVEIGGVIATTGTELYENMIELDSKGLATTPAYAATQVVVELLSSAFYASEIAQTDPSRGAKIMSDLIQPTAQGLAEVFSMAFQTYAETGQIDMKLQEFMLEARDIAVDLYNEIYGYNDALATSEMDNSE